MFDKQFKTSEQEMLQLPCYKNLTTFPTFLILFVSLTWFLSLFPGGLTWPGVNKFYKHLKKICQVLNFKGNHCVIKTGVNLIVVDYIANCYILVWTYHIIRTVAELRLGVKRVTEPNRTNGLYRTEPTEISDCFSTGFYLRHQTKPINAIFTAYFIIISFSILSN